MGMALDILERVEGKQLLRAVQAHLGLTPSACVVADMRAARAELARRAERRPTFGRLDEGGES